MTEIKMKSIRSSNLDKVGYDDSSETLRIQFKNGTTYDYSGIPKFHFLSLLTAKSSGSYFSRYISKSGYKFKKLEKENENNKTKK